MTVVAALQDADALAAEPGQTTSCQLVLSNTGTIVEQYTIMILGEGAEWIRPDPPVVSMFPGAQQTVTLNMAPPRAHTTPSGPVAFAVKVIPSTEPEESVTEEGVITVGSFNDVGAELIPKVSNGRIAGRQRLAVDSRGNVPIPVDISAIDPSDAIQFRMSPSKLTAVPGAAHFVRIRVRPRKRFLKGPPQQKPYQVIVKAENERPLVLDGGFTQRALVPKWLLALIAILAALVLLWFFLIKPVVHDTAVSADQAALAAQKAQTAALKNQVAQAQAQAASAQATANKAASNKPGAPAPSTSTSTTTTTVPKKPTKGAVTPVPTVTTTTGPPTTAPPVTGPADNEIEVVAAPGATQSNPGVNGNPPRPNNPLPQGTTINITDLVVQNISGGAGTARVQRVNADGSTHDLLIENLGTLKDQEYTFNTPINIYPGQQLQLRVDCAGNQSACDVAMYWTGPETQPANQTTTTG